MKPALGTPAEQRRSLLRWFGPLVLARVEMDTAGFAALLRAHPRLIMTIVHGGVVSWLPIGLAMIQATLAVAPQRRIIGTMHPIVWKLPGLRQIAAILSGADEAYVLSELQAALSSGVSVDYYAFPESENCLYGDLGEVKPFRFLGFIELAVRAQVPMLLIAHRGSERWYRPLDLSGRLFPALGRLPPRAFEALELNKDACMEAIKTYHDLNVPLPHGRVPLQIAFELHYPERFETGFSDDWRTRRRQVAAEGERIRERMQALRDSLER